MMSDPAKLFRTVTNFTIFDNNLIGHAREVFDDYIEKGIILSYDFDHHKWETTNEYANVTFFIQRQYLSIQTVLSAFLWYRL